MKELYIFLCGLFMGGSLSYLFAARVVTFYRNIAQDAHKALLDLHIAHIKVTGQPLPNTTIERKS
jgi:hypothetical protein